LGIFRKTHRRIFKKSAGRICLINLPRSIDEVHIPLGLLSLSACLEEASFSSSVIDFDLMHMKGEISCDDTFLAKAVSMIDRLGTDIYGITADCANYPLAVRFAQYLHQMLPESLIILGGPQATFVAVETLKAFPEIDVIVTGEGEVTLCELLKAFQNHADLRNVRGIVYRENGNIIATASRDLIENLDSIPYPVFQAYPVEDYLRLSMAKVSHTYLPLEVGRGCPKNCYYCATSRMWRRVNRTKSPERVYQEMLLCQRNFSIEEFFFVHDNIVANNRFFMELCMYLIGQRSPFKWSCSASTDRLSKELINLMAKAGCTNVFLGVESGSPKMQRIMGKMLDIHYADNMVETCLGAGLGVLTSFIMGFPEETREDLDMTLEKALKYRLGGAKVQFSQLSPFAGTPLYKEYLHDLFLGEDSSCMSPRHFQFNDCKYLISQYPEIFSSFYTVPRANYADINLTNALYFYDIIFGYYAHPFANVLDAVKSVREGPLDVYEHWEKWRMEKHFDTKITPDFVFYSFNEFLDCYDQIISGMLSERQKE
jgi:radical SAM superfamily enzyme YgiQ (UPF0313 family)